MVECGMKSYFSSVCAKCLADESLFSMNVPYETHSPPYRRFLCYVYLSFTDYHRMLAYGHDLPGKLTIGYDIEGTADTALY